MGKCITINDPIFYSVRTDKPLSVRRADGAVKDARLSDLIRSFCIDLFDKPIEGRGFELTNEDASMATNVLDQLRVNQAPQVILDEPEFKWLQGKLRKCALVYFRLDSARIIGMTVECPPAQV